MKNPFLEPSLLNIPFTLEKLQEIHFHALQQITAGISSDVDLPSTINWANLRKNSRSFGYESFFFHPATIDDIFQEITTDVYKTIKSLYCDPIARPIKIIYKILDAMAREANISPVNYEAIWAICIYNDQFHNRWTVMNKAIVDDSWHIYTDNITINAIDSNDPPVPYQIILVENTNSEEILSFSLVTERDRFEEVFSIALYKALCTQREPAARHTFGLIWKIPSAINIHLPTSLKIQTICENIGIKLCISNSPPPQYIQSFLDAIKTDINKVFQSKLKMDIFHFVNSYMSIILNQTPNNNLVSLDKQRHHLVGYNRDPSTILPQLRDLLPEHNSIIQNGTIAFNDLHYSSPLLRYWPEHPVTLRISPHAESRCWVFMDGEVLCEARAQELQQRDGSYRDFRNIR